jgi:abhydrolase domain-containing protein 17
MWIKSWFTRFPSWHLLWRIPLISYLTLAGYAYFFSDRQIFLPQYAENSPLPQPPIELMTRDQEKITAVHLPNPKAKYTILYSHGNGETLGDIYPKLLKLRDLGFSVFAYDYRGYGLSQGKPSVDKAYRDIDAAYEYVINTLKIPADRIIVFGRSVGSGPSVYLASRQASAGLILESAFTSTFRVVVPVKILPFDKFPNQERLPKVKVPILIIHGTEDEVIPFSHGQALYQTASQPKTFLTIEGAGHNDVTLVGADRYFNALRNFANAL